MTRLVVVVALLLALALAKRLHADWRRRLRDERRPVPLLPASLVDGADRTWVVFTTPLCASCGTVEDQLRTADPTARVVRVDATREPALAGAFHVRSAPTVLLADGGGEVQRRLVGADAVADYVRIGQ